MRIAFSLLILLAACSKDTAKNKAPDPQVPNPATKQDEPVVIDAGTAKADSPYGSKALILTEKNELRRFNPGGSDLLAKIDGADECGVDEPHNVVWIRGRGTLSAYDRETGKIVVVATQLPKSEVWGVHYNEPRAPTPTKTAGNYNGLNHCLALILTVSDKPTLVGEYVGDGDREVYCGEYGDAEEFVLFDEQKKMLAKLTGAKLSDPKYVAGLAQRRSRKRPPQLAKSTAPGKPTLTIDKAKCEEEPDNCGALQYLGGGRIWQVTTANSRGDFYHEDYQLYDSKDSMYWDPETDKKSKTLFPEGSEMHELEVAADGTWGIYNDKMISLVEGKSLGEFSGAWCGWE